MIDGIADDVKIAEAFAEHFHKTCTSFNESSNERLKSAYNSRRANYVGDPVTDEYTIDVELVESVVFTMKWGKAAGLDELTGEHIVNSHPVLISILARLFNIIMSTGHVPLVSDLSNTVPLPKEDRSVKNNTVENYRAISISPIVSKIFEHCVLKRYNNFFDSSYNQFGFKKNSSCSHAVYSVRKVVEHYVNGGSTVNVCLLDLSKAFDKVNHFPLYIELMNRSVPITLVLCLLVVY